MKGVGSFGQRATQFTPQRITGVHVRVELMDRERYGRSIGVVYAKNGQNVNNELIQAGMAWVYPQYCRASFCSEWKSVEQNARRVAVGLGFDKNPVPPREWRKMRRSR